jgi:hypothetical protein
MRRTVRCHRPSLTHIVAAHLASLDRFSCPVRSAWLSSLGIAGSLLGLSGLGYATRCTAVPDTHSRSSTRIRDSGSMLRNGTFPRNYLVVHIRHTSTRTNSLCIPRDTLRKALTSLTRHTITRRLARGCWYTVTERLDVRAWHTTTATRLDNVVRSHYYLTSRTRGPEGTPPPAPRPTRHLPSDGGILGQRPLVA